MLQKCDRSVPMFQKCPNIFLFYNCFNIVLQKFRKDTFMEFLKGIHYISLTSISIKEPLFFIIFCIAIVLNYFGNREEYSDPYERSLLYSFLLLFFILDYKKITNICLFDKLLLLSFSSSSLSYCNGEVKDENDYVGHERRESKLN